MEVRIRQNRSSRPEPVDCLDPGTTRCRRNLAAVVLIWIRRQRRQRRSRDDVETQTDRQSRWKNIRAKRLELLWTVQRKNACLPQLPDIARVTELGHTDRRVAGIIGWKVVQRGDARIGLPVVIPVEPFEISAQA